MRLCLSSIAYWLKITTEESKNHLRNQARFMQDFFSLMDEDKMSEIIVDLDEARRDLAAIFRWIACGAMHEGVANHFSFAVSNDGQQFLMNPYGVHFFYR